MRGSPGPEEAKRARSVTKKNGNHKVFFNVDEHEVRKQVVYNRINNRLKALEEHNQEKLCRICFSSGEPAEQNKKKSFRVKNPLLSPCNCTGSSRYIHLECL